MNSFMRFVILIHLFTVFAFIGCGRKSQEINEPIKLGVNFKEGQGLEVPEETRKALNLSVIEVVEQPMTSSMTFRLQIYSESSERPKGSESAPLKNAYGSAILTNDQTKQIKIGQEMILRTTKAPAKEFRGKVIRINTFALSTLGGVEALVEVPDPENYCKLGTELDATIQTGKSELVPTIPRSALLKTFKGTFVYVVNDKSFLRTAVTIGTQNGDSIEIREGLYLGDQVVKTPVSSLWLAELQAVNAGQSCCAVGH
jgi:multidrug efflux pump subunit AcrA (membrane-fusion protein)